MIPKSNKLPMRESRGVCLRISVGNGGAWGAGLSESGFIALGFYPYLLHSCPPLDLASPRWRVDGVPVRTSAKGGYTLDLGAPVPCRVGGAVFERLKVSGFTPHPVTN